MNIEYAKKEDKGEIIKAWKYCFNDTDEYVDYYFENRYDPNTTLLLKEDGEIKSSLQKNEYRMKVAGSSYDIPYIVGVSTLPQHRGHGYMGRLLTKSFYIMREEGRSACILMPIDNSIYRRFGFENISYNREYKLSMDSLSKFKKIFDIFPAKASSTKDISRMSDIYMKCVKGKNLCPERNEKYFEKFIKELEADFGHVYLEQEGEYNAYLAYSINGGTFAVREIMYDSLESLSSMLGFIYSHSTQADEVLINTFENDHIIDLIPNIRKDFHLEIKPFLMGRIIDSKGFMERMKPDFDFDSLKIGVVDKLIPENESGLDISCKGGEMDVRKIPLGECDALMDISSFSQMTFSSMDVENLVFLKKIDIKNEDCMNTLKKVFVKRSGYFNEYV